MARRAEEATACGSAILHLLQQGRGDSASARRRAGGRRGAFSDLVPLPACRKVFVYAVSMELDRLIKISRLAGSHPH